MPKNAVPGVYIEGTPGGTRTIAGVSTSVLAVVDWFSKGEIGKAVRVTSEADFERTYGGLHERSAASYAVRQFFANGGTDAWVVRVAGGTPRAATKMLGTGRAKLVVTARSAGTWGESVRIGARVAADGRSFDLVVREFDGTKAVATETFRGLTGDDRAPNRVETVVNRGSNLVTVRWTGPIDSFEPGTGGGTKALEDWTREELTPLEHGAEGIWPGIRGDEWRANGAAILTGSAARKDGLQALRHIAPDLFNLLIVPAAAELASDEARAVYTTAGKLCDDLRAFLLVDVPTDRTRDEDVVQWVGELRDRNSAVFFPRVRIADPLKAGRPKEVAPSGTVAGVFARTDSRRGVWKAPAGIEAQLQGASPVELINDARSGSMSSAGINVLRTLPTHGSVVWGSRTTLGADVIASEWKYVPVRRLALHLEESLVRGLEWAVFEPNDEPLWAQIRLAVGAFLHTQFRQGAFQAASPQDAYRVVCDSSTTTRSDIDEGIVNVVVMFAPLKPAEFVVIRIRQRAGRAKS